MKKKNTMRRLLRYLKKYWLLLILSLIFCLEEMNTKRIYAIPFVLIFAASYFVHCDYGIGGVLLICMFYLTRETPWMRS